MFLNPFNRLKLLQETKQSSFFTGLEIKLFFTGLETLFYRFIFFQSPSKAKGRDRFITIKT